MFLGQMNLESLYSVRVIVIMFLLVSVCLLVCTVSKISHAIIYISQQKSWELLVFDLDEGHSFHNTQSELTSWIINGN